MKGRLIAIILAGLFSTQALADSITVKIYALEDNQTTKGIGRHIGIINLTDSEQGLLIKSQLSYLPPGPHGFHVHEKGSCEGLMQDGKWVPGLAAGGHYDPADTEQHLGPTGQGHLGDLPLLLANEHGQSEQALMAPRLTTEDIKGRALIIHQHGDNYADSPSPLGGGGPRIACGIIGEGG